MSKEIDIEELKSKIIKTVINPTIDTYLDLINRVRRAKTTDELDATMNEFVISHTTKEKINEYEIDAKSS